MIGNILQVAVLIVIPFTLMGQVLGRTGGAAFFADLAMSGMGKFSRRRRQDRGGRLGTVRHDFRRAVSNVVAVGIVTIPLMVRSGFSRVRAAAIEAVGSTGGQLMPPVMGAAAFIMAEFLQVSYGAVVRRGRDPGAALLRGAVHSRRSGSRQAQDRRGAGGRGNSVLSRNLPVGLAFPDPDRCF